MSTELRNLVNKISFSIDDSPLRQSDKLVDDFKAHVQEINNVMGGFGEAGAAAGQGVAEGMKQAGAEAGQMGKVAVSRFSQTEQAAAEAQQRLHALGQEARAVGQQAQRAIDSANESLSEFGEEAQDVFSVFGAGMLAMYAGRSVKALYTAASEFEQTEARLRLWFGAEAGTWREINSAVSGAVEFSKGMYREIELLSAVHAGAQYGLDPSLTKNMLNEIIVLAEASGDSIESTMSHIAFAIEMSPVRHLQRLGIVARDTLTEMEAKLGKQFSDWERWRREMFVLGLVQDSANEKMELYGEYTEIAAVKLDALKGSWRNTLRVAGEPVVAVLKEGMDVLRAGLDALSQTDLGRPILQFAGIAASITAAALAFTALKAGLAWFGGTTLFAGGLKILGFPIAKFLGIAAGVAAIGQDVYKGLTDEDRSTSLTGRTIDWFGNLFKPKDGLSGEMEDELKNVRDMLPHSPVRAGPLVGLREAGSNIIEQLRLGMRDAGPLGIDEYLPTNEGGVGMPALAAGYGGPSFSAQISVSVGSGEAGGSPEALATAIEHKVRNVFEDLMEQYYRKLASKQPRVVEA